jgi:glycosyltransferase involved in cell wall biosynthesis
MNIPPNSQNTNEIKLISAELTQAGLVSVIIPTFNRPDRLVQAIQSVLAQTYQQFEIIVVNDCGEELNPELFRIDSLSRITYHRNQVNKGLAGTRNVGLGLARGQYIAYLDDDDIFYPNHLETLVNSLQKGKHKVAYTDACRGWEKTENGIRVVHRRDVPYSVDFNEDILQTNFIPVLCVMHERDCLFKVGVFDAYLKRTEDWDLWIRLSRSFPFQHLQTVTCEFSWRDDGTSMTSSTRDSFDWAELNIYYKYRASLDSQPERQSQVGQQARNALMRIKQGFYQDLTEQNSQGYKRLLGGGVEELANRIAFLSPYYSELRADLEELTALLWIQIQRYDKAVTHLQSALKIEPNAQAPKLILETILQAHKA